MNILVTVGLSFIVSHTIKGIFNNHKIDKMYVKYGANKFVFSLPDTVYGDKLSLLKKDMELKKKEIYIVEPK